MDSTKKCLRLFSHYIPTFPQHSHLIIFAATGVKDNWKVRLEKKRPSFWYAEGETRFALTSLCSASVWTLVTTNVRELCWQLSDFLCLPSHCNLSLPSAEEAVITQSSQTTTSIDQNLFLYHRRPAFCCREKSTMNFQRADLYRGNVCQHKGRQQQLKRDSVAYTQLCTFLFWYFPRLEITDEERTEQSLTFFHTLWPAAVSITSCRLNGFRSLSDYCFLFYFVDSSNLQAQMGEELPEVYKMQSLLIPV